MLSSLAARVLLALGILLVLGAGAAVGYDTSRTDRLAEGIRIGGVDVGGLDRAAAERRLHTMAVAPQRRSLRIHTPAKTWVLTAAQLQVTADVDAALDRALAVSRRGWIGARVARGLAGEKLRESMPLKTHYAPGVLPRVVAEIAAANRVEPVDATVKPTASGLERVASRDGLRVDTGALFRSLETAVQHRSRPADIDIETEPVPAKVTIDALAEKYPAYIVVDRKGHKLRFFENLEPFKTWPIAVGKAGLETPSGLYDVQWRDNNPSWHVPDSDWAGELRGTVVPPGPDNPIKARWLAFNGGAGIHGIDPSQYSSIGTDASHGCVRMRIPDVISLYKRSPVGTPVFVA